MKAINLKVQIIKYINQEIIMKKVLKIKNRIKVLIENNLLIIKINNKNNNLMKIKTKIHNYK